MAAGGADLDRAALDLVARRARPAFRPIIKLVILVAFNLAC